MVKKTIIIFVLLALMLSACTITSNGVTINPQQLQGSGTVISEKRDVSGFTRVDLKGIGNLTITHGSAESLTIKADDNILPNITSSVINGTLEIGMKPTWNIKPSRTIEYELVVKDLSAVTLSGFGNVNVDSLAGTIMQVRLTGSGDINLGDAVGDSLDLRLSGFGNVDVDKIQVKTPSLDITGSGDLNIRSLQADDLNLRISGFGNATVVGSAASQDVRVTGSGDYRGADLESDTATIEISGFGNARVWAKNDLTVRITGSGNVEYYGSPRINQTISGFGKVNTLGEH
jgi:hypothetical protein